MVSLLPTLGYVIIIRSALAARIMITAFNSSRVDEGDAGAWIERNLPTD